MTPDPRSLPAQVPPLVYTIGGVRIGLPDLLIAGIGLTSAVILWLFLTRTKLGWAVRATAQDRDAALQMGVDADRDPVAHLRDRLRRWAGVAGAAGRHLLQQRLPQRWAFRPAWLASAPRCSAG